MMNAAWCRVALSGAASILAGCAPTYQTVPLSPPNTVVLQDSSHPGSPRLDCLVRVRELTDERHDKGDIGRMGTSIFAIEDGAAWLARGMKALEKASYRYVQTATSVGPDASRRVEARVALKSVYVLPILTQRSAQVVVTLQLASADGSWQAPQVLRGTHAGVNWVNGNAEASGAIDLALEDLLLQLDESFRQACGAPAR